MADFAALYRQHFDDMVDRTTKQLIERSTRTYGTLSYKELHPRVIRGLKTFQQDLDDGTSTVFAAFWAEISYDRARQGYDIDDMQLAITVAEEVARMLIYEQLEQPVDQLHALELVYHIISISRRQLFEAFVRANEEVIRSQAASLQELSSPIIPIYEGILVLPLVGAIDSQRAAEVMENLLSGITLHQAEVVLIDITGVPVVDTGVANALVQTARAAQLLGARVVLVGIGAEIAQTLIQLGVELRGISTQANLQSGLEQALNSLGLQISRRR